MSAQTSIEWTDRTWNPVRGCSMARGSEKGGCLNCYAARLAARGFAWAKGLARMTENGPRWTGKVGLVPEMLDEPLRWRKPQRIFVNSMSDLFHEALIYSDIAAVFAVMACSPHTFQVLTKRPARMLEFCRLMADRNSRAIMTNALGAQRVDFPHALQVPLVWPLPNVWLGTSVEDQATADERIPLLLQTPAAVRFISLEPQLARVDLFGYATGHHGFGLDWVIQGGESGPVARPFRVEWAYDVREQCRAAGVAYFLKQLGSLPTWDHALSVKAWPSHVEFRKDVAATNVMRLRSKKGGDPLEWPPDLRDCRAFPQVSA